MKQYTIGKKAAVIVLHQLCMVLMVTGVYATGYAFRHEAHGNIDIYTLISLAGLVGSFVSLAYMANVAGRKSEDDYTIYYLPIDKVYSDVMLVIFTLLMVFMGKVISGVKNQHFDYASLIMTVGTFTFLFDLAFIIFYQSIVRKIKGNILCTHSLIYKGYELLKRVIEKKDIHTQKNKEIMRIQEALEAISEGALDTTLNVNEFHGQQKKVAEAVNHIRQGLMSSVNESLKNEKLKADLITNVSHDIKTPLTSIVNYVDLLKRENLDNDNAKYYIHVLEEKSQRLKQLTEDLVETSKITSGNVKLNMQKLDLVELLYQTGGEFNERFEARNLTIVTKIPSEQIFIYADGRQLYRSIENLYTNAAKYALENTRVYVELEKADTKAVFTIKNVSKNELDIVSDGNVDLTERFVRGERSRTTEGSGLGLSIAKNLTHLMGGKFEIKVDGDLFIATITYNII
ncbi:MAG: HAMP domain-containing sensor histidine kinase [Agathobacter sp.]|uniref:sensor histidine kinase n=1 Tax=Agathobacter sp. TaxID=2021311 RepID=UPI002E79764F|nr:HAMP domain-containing sensor histidine kinase [Agathobacter sp.]MEE1216799.1 HAMP domain-containing sensor histidine kinase [Agathobacter sp.]